MANPTVLGLLYAHNDFLHSKASENWVKFNEPFDFTLNTNANRTKNVSDFFFLFFLSEMFYLENKVTHAHLWKVCRDLKQRGVKNTHLAPSLWAP